MIFIFLDGVGIGKRNKFNPFFSTDTDYLPFYSNNNGLPDSTPIKNIDAVMGINGIPQSATGQTSIYTGKNIPKIIGKHQGSFPNKKMRTIIKESNIFSLLKSKGLSPMFLNAYPAHSELFYKSNVDINENGEFNFSENFPDKYKSRVSVTSSMMIVNGMKPFDIDDIIAKNSIYQEYSNSSLKKYGLNLPEYSPEDAAEIIYKTSRKYDFLLYEYFQTDIYGHRKKQEDCEILIKNINRLIKKLILLSDKEKDTIIITSDHGNIEDMSVKTHTTNPVPFLVWGYKAKFIRDRVTNLSDITSAIIDFFKYIKKSN